MRTPRIHIAYAPRAGLRCAIAYLESHRDAYGWFIGQGADGAVHRAYFVAEDFYSPREARYVEVAEGDLHSAWTTDEARCHELAALQDAFAHEWLAFRGDAAAAQFEAYASAELAAGDVTVRFDRLDSLDRRAATWTFWSPGFDRGLLDFLRARWPLDYGREEQLAA